MAAVPVTRDALQPSTRRVRLSENTDEIPYVADFIYKYKMDGETYKRSQERAIRRRANRTKGEDAHRRSAFVSAWFLRLEVEKYMEKACPARNPDLPDTSVDDNPETGDTAYRVCKTDSAYLNPQANAEETQSKVSSDSDDNRHEGKRQKYRQYVAGIVGALKSLRFPTYLRGIRLPRRTSMTRARHFRDEHLNTNARNSGVSSDERELRVSNSDVDVRGTMHARRFTSRSESADSQGFNCIGPRGDVTLAWL